MANMVRYDPRLPAQRGLQNQIAPPTRRMQLHVDQAKAAMDEIGHLHQYAEWSVASTLRTASQIQQTLLPGPMTEDQEAAQHARQRQYLIHVNQLVLDTGGKIVEVAHEAPQEERSKASRIIQ